MLPPKFRLGDGAEALKLRSEQNSENVLVTGLMHSNPKIHVAPAFQNSAQIVVLVLQPRHRNGIAGGTWVFGLERISPVTKTFSEFSSDRSFSVSAPSPKRNCGGNMDFWVGVHQPRHQKVFRFQLRS